LRVAGDPDCLFCKIVAGDIPATIVHEDSETIAFMDINPATKGHLLVIPRRHARDLHSADPADVAAVHKTAQRMADLAIDRLGAEGVNIFQSNGEAAGQTVFHLHVHVIPRYEGDSVRLPWVPAPGDQDEIAAAAAALSRN
jgi:histidine triad (HIT) family protein